MWGILRSNLKFKNPRSLKTTLIAEGSMEAAFTKASKEAPQVNIFLLTRFENLRRAVTLSLVLSGQLKS